MSAVADTTTMAAATAADTTATNTTTMAAARLAARVDTAVVTQFNSVERARPKE